MRNQNPALGRHYLWAMLIILCQCFTPVFALDCLNHEALDETLDKHLESKRVKGALVGMGVWNADSGEQMYGFQDSLFMVPASTQKLFTAVAAIQQLGPDFRWQTHIGYRGEIAEGTLKGDLVLIAGGDPSWYEDFWPQGGEILFRQWADSLWAMGIRAIDGKLVADVSYFPTQAFNYAWELTDKPYYFTPAVSSLSFNANRIVFEYRGGKAKGKKVKINNLDGYDQIRLINNLKTSSKSKSANTWAEPTDDPGVFVAKGSVPAGKKAVEKIAVRQPELFALQVLGSVLKKRGISISGKPDVLTQALADSLWNPVLLHRSPPLKDIIQVMLKTSSNFLAENVMHTLGHGQEPGIEAIISDLDHLGVPVQGMKLADGSGLSRLGLCSPRQMGSLLCLSVKEPWFELFFGSLPVGGVDGTLKNRFTKSPIKGNVFAKTGSMTGISCLAGYVRTQDQQLLAVVIFCSKLKSVATARKWQDELCGILYRYSDD